MKQLIASILLCLCAVIANAADIPQEKAQQAKKRTITASFWVVETGSHSGNKYSVIRFYSAMSQLLSEARINGVHLDAAQPRTQRKLNRALKNIAEHPLEEAALIRKYRL